MYEEALEDLPVFDLSLIPTLKMYFPEFLQLKINLCNNLMFAFIKLQNYEEALKNGITVMKIDPKNVKTIYRIGQVYFYQNDFLRARAILLEALKID